MSKMSNTTTFSDVNIEQYQCLDKHLQSMPHTKKEFQSEWQAYKYMLCNKMYAYVGIDDRNSRPIITLKLDPILSEIMRTQHEDIVPGYYMNKTHWSSIYLDGDVPQSVIKDMVNSSYKLLRSSLTKKLQKELEEM